MTAIEEIEQAITKLEALWAGGASGPWDAAVGRGEGGSRDYCVINRNDVVADAVNSDTAELIGVLHRTIDAQLAILQAGFAFAQPTAMPDYIAIGALALARAINGGVA